MTDYRYQDLEPEDDALESLNGVQPEPTDFESLVDALQTEQTFELSSKIFYGLSALEPEGIARLRPVWDSLTPVYRRTLMRQLIEVAEANFELDYGAIGRLGLQDSDPGVREAAIEVLWEDQTVDLMNRLIDMMSWDDVREVRAAAASALGRFILAGELDELPEAAATRAQDAVVAVLNNHTEDVDVRRRALESIANCGHEVVDDAIREAYEDTDERMRVSALFAMGRTCDDNAWRDIVMRELESQDPAMRYEAARAAGELELHNAIPRLSQLAQDQDRELKDVAIWSLGEIGGQDALRVLNRLADSTDPAEDAELAEAIEDAIANADLMNDDLLDEDDE
ncbi:MAG: HEAT repeat domain-containing protein [Chloroflexi bacterium]|nr:HEAT repeat domain-containing protein [Chloroflexota bacterium]